VQGGGLVVDAAWQGQCGGGCCELFHGTLDVCTVTEVRKYHSMCKMVDSVYVAVETQQRIFC
jgi:hypothetical protein